MEKIRAIMDGYAGKVTGQLGIGFRSLTGEGEYYVNGDSRFPSASVFKVPVLIELFAQAEQGKINLDTVYTMQKEDIAPGSGALSVLTPGVSMTVRDYATLMMILSDNTGTDITYKLVGRENIRARIDALGLADTRSDLNCRELILSLYGLDLSMTRDEVVAFFNDSGWSATLQPDLYVRMDSPNDITSPKDMVKAFSMLWNREILTPKACEEMLGIMERCQTNSRIPYHLPFKGDNAATVMHKTGSLKYVANDCGIVRTKSHTYALSILYNGFNASQEEKDTPHFGDYLLADLSRDIFNAVHGL